MRKIELDEFCKISYLGGLSVSPDADKLCFIRSIASAEKNQYLSSLWLYDPSIGFKRLTNSGKDKQATWLDQTRILFASNRDESSSSKSVYYTMATDGGEPERYFETCHDISHYKIIDDNHWLVQISYEPEIFELQQAQDEKAIEAHRKENESWQVMDEIPFWSNGDGFTNKKRNALGILNLQTKKIELLTDALTDVYSFDLSPDKQKVALVFNSFRHVMSIYCSLGLIDLHTKLKREISQTDQFIYERCQFASDTELYAYGKSGSDYGVNENGKFYKFDLSTDTPVCHCLLEPLDLSAGCSVGSDVKYGAGDGSWLFNNHGLVFSATQGTSCNLYQLTDSGTLSEVTAIDGAIFNYQSFNGGIIFNALKDGLPMALYFLKDGALSTLTHEHEVYGKDIFHASPESLNFTTSDGTDIEGYVMKPWDFREGRRYPTILNIHGGPKTVYGSVYYHEMQYWASEGFVVIYCNPRGSDGKGNAFADIRGKYGTIDYHDLMDFVDHAISQCPFIHPERLGVTGGSYGGFMTNWIVGHTDRFRAAATQRSIANWISKYGTTDIGYFFVEDQIGATPWSNVQKLWDHSPLKYADRMRTPMLVLHSEEDYRCWLAEGIQMFTALKANQVPAKMVMFHGENHELSRSGKPLNRIKRLKEITEWMRHYLVNSHLDNF